MLKTQVRILFLCWPLMVSSTVEGESPLPQVKMELSVCRSEVGCGDALLLRMCVARVAELDVLSFWIGSYSTKIQGLTFEVIHVEDKKRTAKTDFPEPPSMSVGGLGDNQGLRLEKVPSNTTFSRVDVLYLSEPGQYRIRGVVDWQYAFGESLDALETVHVNDWTNWVAVTVWPPKHEGDKAGPPTEVTRDALMERMFEYYYPQDFVYYSYEWEERWNESRGRKRFSLEALWRESLNWSRENPWREYLHFTAAAEAIADSLTRFHDERNLREREALPQPYRPEYVAEVVCSLFKEYPDSWLIPQLLYHYNRFFFWRFGRAIPCIEEAYNKYAQQTDPVHAALHRPDGRPNRRQIYNENTRETEVVIE